MMRKLFDMDRRDYDPKGKAFIRPSARCIAIEDGRVAMVHSLKYDYYKFPGGGIEAGEDPVDALLRETAEEAGRQILPESVEEYGQVRRAQKSEYPDTEYFVQDNSYFLCRLSPEPVAQRLDDYEAEERFTLEYVTPEQAITANRTHDHGPKDQQMLEREARVLELLRTEGYFDSAELRLWHVGFAELPQPDIHHGRRNADFGQGFYLSDDLSFSQRWAKERRGMQTYINEYILSLKGLRVKRLHRDAEWYNYISQNRAGVADVLAEYDVITGPIANDTLYDTWGILTSGLVSREKALYVLSNGPAYRQVVIKTEKAASQLRWLSARIMPAEEIAAFRATVRQEEQAYQAFLAGALGEVMAVLRD